MVGKKLKTKNKIEMKSLWKNKTALMYIFSALFWASAMLFGDWYLQNSRDSKTFANYIIGAYFLQTFCFHYKINQNQLKN